MGIINPNPKKDDQTVTEVLYTNARQIKSFDIDILFFYKSGFVFYVVNELKESLYAPCYIA